MRRMLLLFAGLAVGCDSPTTCVDVPVAAISVLVRDSASGAPAASGAQLLVRDGAYADSTAFPPGHPELDAAPLFGAENRPGIYQVTVRKAGYWDWVRSGVKVTEGRCNVNTVRLTARLQQLISATARL